MSSNTYLQPPSQRKLMGLAMAVLLHLLLLWALQAGLAQQWVKEIPNVVQAVLLQEAPVLTPPPATPPSPASAPKPPTPSQTAPAPPLPQQPAYVPPSDVPANVNPSVSTAISAVSSTPPASLANSTAPVPAPASVRQTAPSRKAATVSAAHCEKPDYPSVSRRMEEEGTVSLRFLVGVDGRVSQSEIEKSSGFPRLDQAARAALSKCRFQPATVDGQPEQAWASLKYRWRLD
jgi:protein TonB